MNPEETFAIVNLVATAHDRPVPEGLAEIWHATLGDLPFGLVRDAAIELIKTSPYLPKPAEIRERARNIKRQQDRERDKRNQLDARRHHELVAATETPAAQQRTGADMVRHVLGRLADAGQDAAEGKYLGKERAGDVAQEAVHEWLEKTGLPQDTGTRFNDDAPHSWRTAR